VDKLSYEYLLAHHSGVVSRDLLADAVKAGRVQGNGGSLPITATAKIGDVVSVGDQRYRMIAGGRDDRLQVEVMDTAPRMITTPVRAYCGYHKCLTEYTKKVFKKICRPPLKKGASFNHYYHRSDAFYQNCAQHTISSLSGHAIDLSRFSDIRVVRFIRDPRDLLVSAYFYHKRSAEPWCDVAAPRDIDWKIVNGAVPAVLGQEQSLSKYLNSASVEEGLFAELEFRRHHFDSMRWWPLEDERVMLFKYEDILGCEAAVFNELLTFMELPFALRVAGKYYAKRYSAVQKGGKKGHIRNVNSGQWRQHFTPALQSRFNELYGDILERYGYPLT
jgi:hypothetical protein